MPYLRVRTINGGCRRLVAVLLVFCLTADSILAAPLTGPLVRPSVAPVAIFNEQAISPTRGFYAHVRPLLLDFPRAAIRVFKELTAAIRFPVTTDGFVFGPMRMDDLNGTGGNGGGNSNGNGSSDEDSKHRISQQDRDAILRIVRDQQVSLPLPTPKWMRTFRMVVRQPKEDGDEPAWFRAQVLALARAEAANRGEEPPATYEQARDPKWGWLRPRMLLHPFERMQDSFNDHLLWSFHLIHVPSGKRFVVGQKEVVDFGLLSMSEKNRRQDNLIGVNQKWNEPIPHLSLCLSLVRQPEVLKALLDQPEFLDHPGERARLLGLAELSVGYKPMRSFRIVGHPIVYAGRTLQIRVETLDRVVRATRRLVTNHQLEFKDPHQIPTRLQLVAWKVARAQAGALKGLFRGWDMFAEVYSRFIEQLGAFFVRLALLGRFAGILRRQPREGKSAAEIRRIGSIGAGPAILPRAFQKIAAKLAMHGFLPDLVTFIQMDASRQMLKVGRETMRESERRLPSGLEISLGSIQTRADRLGIATNSLDVAETGLLDSLNPQHRMTFLTELNRVIDKKEGEAKDGGYLILSGRRPIPDELRAILPRFGFQVMTESQAKLSYNKKTRYLMARGRAAAMGRVRARLVPAGYLVAVKVRTLTADEVESLKQDTEVTQALAAFEKTKAKTEQVPVVRRQPQEVPLDMLHLGDVSDEEFLPTSITRDEMNSINSPYRDFDEPLSCLLWATSYLTRREIARRDHLIAQWGNSKEKYLSLADVQWAVKTANRVPPEPLAEPAPEREKTDRRPSPEDIAPPPELEGSAEAEGRSLMELYLEAELARLAAGDETMLDSFRKAYAAAFALSRQARAGIGPMAPPKLSDGDVAAEGAAGAGSTPLPGAPVPGAPGSVPKLSIEDVDPVYEAVATEIQARNTNAEARSRITAEAIKSLVDNLLAPSTEGKRNYFVQTFLNANPRLRGLKMADIYEILARTGLIAGLIEPAAPERPVVPPPTQTTVPPILPGAGAVRPAVPTSTPKPQPAPVRRDPALRAAALQELTQFVQSCFENGRFDATAWTSLTKALNDNVAEIPNTVVPKSAWAAEMTGPSYSADVRYEALNDWLETLNYTYLAPERKLIFAFEFSPTSAESSEWSGNCQLLDSRTSPNTLYTLALPPVEGPISMPETQVPVGLFHSVVRPEVFQRGDGIIDDPTIGILTWGDANAYSDFHRDLITQPWARVFGGDFRDIPPGNVTPGVEQLAQWSKRYRESYPDGRATESDFLRSVAVTSIAVREAGKRLVLAGVVPSRLTGLPFSSQHRRGSTGTMDSFFDKYLDQNGFLFESLQNIPETLRPSPESLFNCYRALHQLDSPFVVRTMLELVSHGYASAERHIRLGSDRLVTLFLVASYLHPTHDWDLASMLRSGKAPSAMVEAIGGILFALPDESIRKIGRSILDENFRARLIREKGRGVRLVETSAPAETTLPTKLARDIGRGVEQIAKNGYSDPRQAEHLLRIAQPLGIPLEPLRERLSEVSQPESPLSIERRYHLLMLPRLLNDTYFGPRGVVFWVTSPNNTTAWAIGLDRRVPFHIDGGAFQGEIAHYQRMDMPGIVAIPHEVYQFQSFGLMYSPAFARQRAMDVLAPVRREVKNNNRLAKHAADNPEVARRLPISRLWSRWVSRGYGKLDVNEGDYANRYKESQLILSLIDAAMGAWPIETRGAEATPGQSMRGLMNPNSPLDLPAFDFISKHLRPGSELTAQIDPEALDGPKTASELHERMVAVESLFSLLNATLDGSTPAQPLANIFLEIHTSQLQQKDHPLPLGERMYIAPFVGARQVLSSAAMPQISMQELGTAPTTSPVWTSISDDLLHMRDDQILELAERFLRENFTVRAGVLLKEHRVRFEPLDLPQAGSTAARDEDPAAQIAAARREYEQMAQMTNLALSRILMNLPEMSEAWQSRFEPFWSMVDHLQNKAALIDALASGRTPEKGGLRPEEIDYFKTAARRSLPETISHALSETENWLVQILFPDDPEQAAAEKRSWIAHRPRAMGLRGEYEHVIAVAQASHLRGNTRSDAALQALQDMTDNHRRHFEKRFIVLSTPLSTGESVVTTLFGTDIPIWEITGSHIVDSSFFALEKLDPRHTPTGRRRVTWLNSAFEMLGLKRFADPNQLHRIESEMDHGVHTLIARSSRLFDEIQKAKLPMASDKKEELITRVVSTALATHVRELMAANFTVDENRFDAFRILLMGAAIGGLALKLATDKNPPDTPADTLTRIAGGYLRELYLQRRPDSLPEIISKLDEISGVNRSETLHRLPNVLKPIALVPGGALLEELIHPLFHYGFRKGFRWILENPGAIWSGEANFNDSPHPIRGTLAGVAASLLAGGLLGVLGHGWIQTWGVVILARTIIDILFALRVSDHELRRPARAARTFLLAA